MAKKKKKESKQVEHPINRYDFKALGTRCFICTKVFNAQEIEDSAKLSKVGLKNIPVRMANIPGFVHRRCRGQTTTDIISNPTEVKGLEDEMRRL